ncbi:hypothetical protein, partial [Leptospira interrogans]
LFEPRTAIHRKPVLLSSFFLKSYSACGVGYGHNRGAGKIFLKVRVSTFMEMIDPGFLVSKD